jgi:hypothetical protein
MGLINALQTCELTASVVENGNQAYIDLINKHIKPPVPVAASDVNIRAMYIISDSINSYGGRFDRTDLPQIARMFIDSPVMIGHDKSGLPVARNFWAETIEKDDQLWVKCYFYWLKEADGADRLKLNIDSGIYKECSVSFTYTFPECSACGKDIRYCGHQVGGDIHFIYRGIEKVLETSLVYRGSIPGTSITDKLVLEPPNTTGDSAIDLNSIYTLTPIVNLACSHFVHPHSTHFKARINGRDFLMIGGKES